MASLGARIWLPNTEDFFTELLHFVANAQQNRTACDSPGFYSRRLEEYQRTLSLLTARIAESYPMEQHVRVESYDRACDQDLLQESYHHTICVPEYRGRVGRPGINVTLQQLNALHNEAGFRWADVSRILGVSERTIRRRRHEFGIAVGRQIAFSDISDNDLDNHVREILTMTPSSGGRLVEGGLRSRGLHIQRRHVQDSIRRVDPVIRTFRSAQTITLRSEE